MVRGLHAPQVYISLLKPRPQGRNAAWPIPQNVPLWPFLAHAPPLTFIRFAPSCTQQPDLGSSASQSPVCAMLAACPLRPLDVWTSGLVIHLQMDIGVAVRIHVLGRCSTDLRLCTCGHT